MAIEYTPEEIAKIFADQEKYNNASQLYYPIAIWLEGILYGLYTMLFVAKCRIMLKKRAVETFASRVFLFSGILIYLLTTIQVVCACYRLVRGYALLVTPPKGYAYFIEYTRWDNFSHLVILALVTWIGDALVIYRCFLVWRRNYWVIVIPTLLFLLSMATTFVNWRWFHHPMDFEMHEIMPVFNMTFPLNLAQNVLTTGLISFKLWQQHRASKASGLQLSSAVNLVTIFRIIVESAMIYTLVTIVIIVLFLMNHPGVIIPQYMLPPSIGMVFSLIAIRTHVARADSTSPGGVSSGGMYPTWLSDNTEGGTGGQRRHINMPITVTTVTEQHNMDVIMSPTSLKMDRGDRSKHDSFEHNSFGPEMKV